MKNKLLVCIGIFLSLAFSRFIPHPPNFTSLIALSFYVPAILGIRYIPVTIISFAITDMIIGYHAGTHWTWGSVFNRFIVLFLVSKNIITINWSIIRSYYFLPNYKLWSLVIRNVWLQSGGFIEVLLFSNTIFWKHSSINSYIFNYY